MIPHQYTLQARRLKRAAAFLLLTLACALCGIGLGSGSAQSNKEEREFKNTIPDHVPIKLKLKNEPSLKKLDNKNWARELEIEVKNTGTKPIYFMYMTLLMEGMTDSGHPLAFQVFYGRMDLVDLSTPTLPDDLPIPPGETVTLKIPDDWVEGYEYYRGRHDKADPKKVTLEFGLINFGDGTGLLGVRGDQFRLKAEERSQDTPTHTASPPQGIPPTEPPRRMCLPVTYQRTFYPTTPASALRVNFSPAVEASTSGSAKPLQSSVQCGCQNDNSCVWGRLDKPGCCDDPDSTNLIGVVPTGGCTSRSGKCFWIETTERPCPPSAVGNPEQTCHFQRALGFCATGDPPPSPTPAPTPAPAPEPQAGRLLHLRAA